MDPMMIEQMLAEQAAPAAAPAPMDPMGGMPLPGGPPMDPMMGPAAPPVFPSLDAGMLEMLLLQLKGEDAAMFDAAQDDALTQAVQSVLGIGGEFDPGADFVEGGALHVPDAYEAETAEGAPAF